MFQTSLLDTEHSAQGFSSVINSSNKYLLSTDCLSGQDPGMSKTGLRFTLKPNHLGGGRGASSIGESPDYR